MRYIIDMAIFGTLPNFTRAVLVARGLDNTQRAAASRNTFQKAAQAAGATFAEQAPTEHPQFSAWQEAYAAFRLDDLLDSSEQTSIPDALVFRTQNTPLANLLNGFGLQNLLPAGGDDLSAITGNVWLRPARGTELFRTIGQFDGAEAPDIGEIIYVDDGPHVLRRRWHGTPGGAAVITHETQAALIYLDCLPPIDRVRAEELAENLSKLIGGFFGADVETYFLTREQPAIEIPS